MITNCTVKEQIVIINTVLKMLSDKRALKSQMSRHTTTVEECISLSLRYNTIDSTLKRDDNLKFLCTAVS
jgi:hypothetical protein